MQNSPLLQLLVLAGIAVFLILRLKSVLGTREGFERPDAPKPKMETSRRQDFEVIEGGPDRDIVDHVEEDSDARGAYEMIVMGYERGELADIKPFLAEDIYDSFAEGVEARESQGLTIEAEFIGVREVSVVDATFDEDTQEAELTIRFVGELSKAVQRKLNARKTCGPSHARWAPTIRIGFSFLQMRDPWRCCSGPWLRPEHGVRCG